MSDYTKIGEGDGVIMTASGKWFNVLDPDPDDVNIFDIAHSLSNQCRFTGHTSDFYSVAQHSVQVTDLCPAKDKLWGLLHDASEAYLSDLARPVKSHPELGVVYREIEDNLMLAICKKFGLEPSMPPSVKEADSAMLAAEARDLMPDEWRFSFSGDGSDDPVAFPGEIHPWEPQIAAAGFIFAFYALTGRRS